MEKSKRDSGLTRLEPIGGDRNNAAFWVLEDDELGKKEDSNAILIAQAAGAGGGWGCNDDYNDDDDDNNTSDEEDEDAKRSLTPTTTKMRGSDVLRVSEKEWIVLDADSVRENIIPGLNKRGYREGKLWMQLQKRFGAKKEGSEEERKDNMEVEEHEKEITPWDVTEEHELIGSRSIRKRSWTPRKNLPSLCFSKFSTIFLKWRMRHMEMQVVITSSTRERMPFALWPCNQDRQKTMRLL